LIYHILILLNTQILQNVQTVILNFSVKHILTEYTLYGQKRHQYCSFTDIKTSSIIHPAEIY